jgi:hypothetical protein
MAGQAQSMPPIPLATIAFFMFTATASVAQQPSVPPAPSPQPRGAVPKPARSTPSPGIVGIPNPNITLSCPPSPSGIEPKCELADVLGAVAWPIVALLGLAAVVLNRQILRGLAKTARGLSRLKGGPVELEFSPDAAKDVTASISQDLADFKLVAQREYDRQAQARDLKQGLKAALTALVREVPSIGNKNFRATIHVPDVVFAGYLYQAIDYVPDGGGSGRRWSERYGILGRAWRMKKSIFTRTHLRNTATGC